MATIGFRNCISDNSLFVYSHGSDIAYILLYVDDIILTTPSDSFRQSLMSKLSLEFAMKDFGPLSYFLGIAVSRNSAGLFLSQHKYVSEILDKAGMSQCKPAPTPVVTSGKLWLVLLMIIPLCIVVWLELCCIFTRPDISYVVQQVCLFMHDPQVEHMAVIHRILRYIQGTLDFGLRLVSHLFSLALY